MTPVAPAAGRLLVATPALGDPNFDRTVVLVLQHGPDGAVGVVLNRPGPVPVGRAFPAWGRFAGEPAVAFSGGPVAPTAAIGLARTDADDERDGWAPLVGRLGTVDLARPPDELPVTVEALRVFTGYAGWGGGQLESEIEAGAWFVVAARPEDAFSRDPSRLWRGVLARQRGRLALFAHAPPDPTVN